MNRIESHFSSTTDTLWHSGPPGLEQLGRDTHRPRYLLTTASSGSAKGLQVISDRVADNFSILPGHHGAGDKGSGDGKDGDCICDGTDEAEDGDRGGIMAKTFAMFE
ncbi:hypothetical protein GOODEAATRI_009155 [Goodea atripinnis]|uniref:Uncharacterized protein n=1 Tax=Goodea atripinnis TaxID=208336 RepID=A0ABV0MGA3_9TELE